MVARVEDLRPASRARGARPPRLFRCFVTLAACLVTGSAFAAAAPEDGSLSNLSLPGGRSGLSKILKLPDSIERALVVLEVTRKIYDTPWGSSETFAARLPEFNRYLDAIAAVQDRRTAVSPDGRISLRLLQAASTGRGAELLNALGLLLRLTPTAAIDSGPAPAAADRRELLKIAGLDVDDLSRRLNAGETAQLEFPAETVPLPLTPVIWSDVVFKRRVPAASLFGAITRDRRAALLYYGLASVDRSTLDYLAEHPEMVARIYRDGAPAFSAFGRSVRVRDGRIDPPGGEPARALWESVIGESTAAPDRFVLKLIERDRGRLALFYDTVAHLNPAGVRLALGPPGETQKARFAALARVFVEADAAWKIDQRPFARNPYDPATLLMELRASDSGTIAPPNQQRLWAAAFETDRLPSADTPPPDMKASDAADSAWVAERVCLADAGLRVDRFETVLFAQRVFAQPSEQNAADVLTALRAFPRYRGLLLTLERIGITDPGVYASAARAAVRLSAIGDPARRMTALAAFQGALSLVERVRFVRSLDVASASTLIQALSTSAGDGWRGSGGMGAWMSGRFLPALQGGKPFEPSANAESLVMGALGGPRTLGGRLVRWEDMTYHVDRAAATIGRLRAAQRTAGGNDLDGVLRLWRRTTDIAADRDRARALKAATEALRTTIEGLADVSAIGRTRVDSTQVATSDALASIARLSTGDDSRAGAILDKLGAALDLLWSDALLRLAYVATIGSLGAEVTNARDLVALHDFGLDEVGERGLRAPWQVPEELTGSGPSHLVGSLLALDLGLAPLALRRMVAEPPDQAPTLNQNDGRTFTENVVLMNPWELTDDGRDLIARAVETGRTRIADAQRDPTRADALAREIGLSEWRVQALPWMIANEPERVPGLFSLAELLWLGRLSVGGTDALDAWGTPQTRSSGCMCTRFPQAEAWENYSGRPMTGQLAARMPDLTVRIAVALASRKLPATLARDVLALATQDLVDQAQPAYPDDWSALVRYVRSVSDDRFDDYLSSVAAEGPMVPVTDASPPSL